jgi:hypothetical protein
LIKNDLIEKQEALLNLLYDENTASADMKALKKEIDHDQERLRNRPLAKISNRPS